MRKDMEETNAVSNNPFLNNNLNASRPVSRSPFMDDNYNNGEIQKLLKVLSEKQAIIDEYHQTLKTSKIQNDHRNGK
jgi:hypothetical protein